MSTLDRLSLRKTPLLLTKIVSLRNLLTFSSGNLPVPGAKIDSESSSFDAARSEQFRLPDEEALKRRDREIAFTPPLGR
jgi:hypothetical protein